MGLRCATVLALLAALGLPALAGAQDPAYRELVGPLHDHSGYSDGWPGTRPADVFSSIKGFGNDFGVITDHSTNMGLPATFSEACYGQGRGGDGEVLLAQCALADGADSFRKWDATADQAAAASDGSFTALRGFEWSSDRFGHINVLLSHDWVNEADTAGYASMDGFWRWF